MTNRQPIIELLDGQRSFGSFKALTDINLSIHEGEIVTLLGPSGCGKTTLMRIIAGFESLSSGTLKIDGINVAGLPPEKRPVNMVFQRYALFPHLDVFENVAYGLKVKRVSAKETHDRVKKMLDIVQMGHLAHRYINELSGGQCQRVALARALVNGPKVLLLDEPLAALDLKIRQHMLGEMKRIQQQTGATFIYVTHDQEEAMILSDRVVLIDRGRVIQIDAPQAMYYKPRSLFAAKFLGETNLLAGTVIASGNGKFALETADGCFDFQGSDQQLADKNSAMMSIRPESITFMSPDAKIENSVPAQVKDIVFTGSRSFFSVVTASGQLMRIQVQNTADLTLPKIGENIRLAWRPETSVVLALME